MDEIIKEYLRWYNTIVTNKSQIRHSLKKANAFYFEQENMFRIVTRNFINKDKERCKYINTIIHLRLLYGIIEVNLDGKTLYLTPDEINKRMLKMHVTHDGKNILSIPFDNNLLFTSINRYFPYVICYKD